MTMKRYRNNRGFTLGEMLITVAITVILVAVSIINVVPYMWNLRLKDADQAAHEIYLAAQYHLNAAASTGALSTYTRDDLGQEDELYKKSYYESAGAQNIYDIVVSPDTKKPAILDEILPYGSVDETMRSGGSYIITYDYDSATVLGVFYSYAGRSYGYKFTSDVLKSQKEALKKAMASEKGNISSDEAKSFRRHFPDGKAGKTIGFYGGKDSDSAAVKSDAPGLNIDNGDTLSALISLNKEQEYLLRYDTGDQYYLQLKVYGITSKKTEVKDLKLSDLTQQSSLPHTYSYILDAYQDKHGKDLKRFGNQFTNLYAGENITVSVSLVKKGNNNTYTSVSKVSNAVKTNSMFAILKKDNVGISSIRHLENLGQFDKKNITVATASQVTDLSFTKYKENLKALVEASNENAITYEPVNLATSLTYDGSYTSKNTTLQHTLSDITTETEKDGGVFGTLSNKKSQLKVTGLEVMNINVKAGGHAGSLLGQAKDGASFTAENVLVWDKTAEEAVQSTGADTDAGGLIGHGSGSVKITNSAASIYVQGKNNAGGLAGYAETLSVNDSYSSGHTYQGKYVTQTEVSAENGNQRYNIIAGNGYAGGLAGYAGTVNSLSNSYTTASIHSDTAANSAVYVGNITDNRTYDQSNCYAVTSLNDKMVTEPSDYKGSGRVTTKYVNDKTLLESESEVAYPYTTVSVLDSTGLKDAPWFLKTHVGDWSKDTTNYKVGKDVALVYYEKVAHTDANGETVYNWYWHGYMQDLNSVSKDNWKETEADPTSVFRSEVINTDNEQSMDGNTVVDGILDDPNTGGYYVVEDGYVLMLKNNNSLKATADKIKVYYGGNTDYNMAESGSLYEGFDRQIGYEGYTCYYLNPEKTVHWGENNEFTIVLNPWQDHTRRAQFYINPFFANNISDKASDFQKGGKYYHNGDIRSARQLNQLFTDGAKFIANSDSGYNYVVSQTMDIDYSRTDFTALGKSVSYQNETLSMNHGTDTSLSGIYQGADSEGKYYHKLIGLTQPMCVNVMYHLGEIRYLNIVNANTSSLVKELNAGSIHDITIDSSNFSANAIAKSGDNGTFQKITIKDTSIAENGVFDSGSGAQISDIQLIKCQIEKNGVAETNANTISNITISSVSIIKGSGICSSNAGTISDVQIQNAVVEGNGIVNSTSYGARISDIRIDSSTIGGDGVTHAVADGTNIDKVSISQTSISGNGFATSGQDWNSTISNITTNDCTIGGDGFINSFNAGILHDITLSNVIISGNGFATALGGRAVYACNIINAQIGKNGFAEKFTRNNSSIVDCHIYADKDVYSNSTKTKFVLSEDSIGGVWNDRYNLYNLTVIGLQPNTKELTSDTDTVSGFIGTIGTIDNSQGSVVYGCSVTASIYGRDTVNGFTDNLENGWIKDCYANTVINAGYGVEQNDALNDATANGFIRVVGNNGHIADDLSSGMILCDADAVNKVTASGFANENKGIISDSASCIWYIQPFNSNVFIAKSSGKLKPNNCEYLYTEGVKGTNTTNGVTKRTAADLEKLSGQSGTKANSDTTKPYYTFVKEAEDGQTVVYPYCVPYQWKYENSNSVRKDIAQTWYGDWYEPSITQEAMLNVYNLDVKIDPDENSSGGNSGSNPGASTDPDEINPDTKLPNAISSSIKDWNSITGNNSSYSIVSGMIYSYNEKIYFGTQNYIVDQSQVSNGNPDVFTEWYKMAQFTGKVWDINDFSSGRNDLNRGDLCKFGNDYYVFKDGGTYSEGPEKSPNQWTKIAIN